MVKRTHASGGRALPPGRWWCDDCLTRGAATGAVGVPGWRTAPYTASLASSARVTGQYQAVATNCDGDSSQEGIRHVQGVPRCVRIGKPGHPSCHTSLGHAMDGPLPLSQHGDSIVASDIPGEPRIGGVDVRWATCPRAPSILVWATLGMTAAHKSARPAHSPVRCPQRVSLVRQAL